MPPHHNPPSASTKMRKLPKKFLRGLMRSHKVRIPKWDLPILFRPWFVVLTVLVMLVLAFLGFTNFSHSLPLNDKALHFLCFMVATGVFYFIFDVEEDARRIWIWRHAGLLLTAFTCFFVGGFMSELVQSLLPYKEFDVGDVAANLAGSAVGLYVSYYCEKYYRQRREISRLYRPIDGANSDSEMSDDELAETLLPWTASSAPNNSSSSGRGGAPKHARKNSVNVSNVWDEREELFGIGDDDFEDSNDAISSRRPTPAPKITVTTS